MNDDNLQENVAYPADASVFAERDEVIRRHRTDALPSTKDSEFWDGETKTVSKYDIEEQMLRMYDVMKNHTIYMEGQEFVCKSCPFPHSISLDPKKYTLDTTGQIVSIDKP